MNEVEVFILADHTLNDVVSKIKDRQWGMEMPPSFATAVVDHTPTLREVINYHAYDDAWVPDMLAGKTIDSVGKDRFAGDLLGDAPRENFAAIVDTACAAAEVLTDFDRTVHCSFGDFTAREYLWQTNYFRGIRAHDIAAVIGADTTLPPALVQGLWEELSPNAEQWRAIGVFGPEVTVPADAPLQDRLLALAGRDPSAA
ncbi:MAG: TIGR03086 family metal-binding protein [Mycobacteriaceae bacterium]